MGKFALLLAILVAGCALAPQPVPQYRLENGLWFDGMEFRPQTVYVVDGHLRFAGRAMPATRSVDLAGGYVVPPFCEGHNHNLGGAAEGVDEVVERYLADGVFYAMMPGSFALYRQQINSKLNHPRSIDVAFANNGLTGPGGHPRGLRESLMERYGLYPEFTKDTLPDRGYFEADTLAEVREKWPLILSERPDFVKVMLFHSEAFAQRRDDPAYFGRRGLDPGLLPDVVTLAEAENLVVAAHVESDADMATALRAGVGIIAHLPSNDSVTRLSDETIALAVESEAAVITTLTVAKRYERQDPERYALILNAQRQNLRRLHSAGAKLVVGSDNVRDTSRLEVDHLMSLGVIDNLAVLKMWTTNCAAMVFPQRKVGRLEEGYEASFLVLKGNPLEDFTYTRQIQSRFKDGVPLAR